MKWQCKCITFNIYRSVSKEVVVQNGLSFTGTLTDRYQTTVPKGVRERLGLTKRGKIAFIEEDNGRVYIENADDRDPALAPFLDLLAADMTAHPERLSPLNEARMGKVADLTAGVELGDMDAPLDPDND